MEQKLNVSEIRKDFPLLMQNPTAYLDNAATAQRPSCVLEAMRDFYEAHNANPLRGFLSVKYGSDRALRRIPSYCPEFYSCGA